MANNRNADSKKNTTPGLIMMAVLVAAALVSGVIAIKQLYLRNRAESELEQLADRTWTDTKNDDVAVGTKAPMQEIVAVEPEPDIDPIAVLQDMGVPIPEKEVDFAALQEETNCDIYAWIYIPNTLIDYPVLQHPSDNSYYLNYNIDGSKGYPGCIYTENYNKKDFADPNTVLYGHNMKNGSMFGNLHKFEDSEFFEENPYVYIYTEDGLLVYEVFAAYESGNEHILYTYDFSNEYRYSEYLEGIFEIRSMNANLREDVPITAKDKIITLSTCISNKPNNRYLVQGVLLNESAE